ncbi:peptidylprolyl isomerase [Paenirhodobacter sp.]|uniref:peptidylprolyl isomerase n=1 Tax=Paenirhodobacter sp. TaxID=1965326 RepID=UPI003B3F6BF6
MTKKVRFSPLLAAALAIGMSAAAPMAQAQSGLFAPVVTVNGMGISRYELEQRARFMQLLRQPGDVRAAAEKSLIEDRLRQWQAKRDGVTLKPEQIQEGMEEFAGRAKLTREQFVAELTQAGVSEQTFRDFVQSGMLWREVIRARYMGRVQVSAADVARAKLVESERGRGTRVLMSEIIIPNPPEHAAEARALAEQVSHLRGEGEFGNAARQVSATASREQGGRLDWVPLQNLPPALRPVILALKPGEATQPIELGGAWGIFMLRALDERGAVGGQPQKLGYAVLALGTPGSQQAADLAARVAAGAKRCDDLYTVAKDLPASVLSRVEPAAQGAIPQDIAVALSHLDIGETTTLQRGGQQDLIMLCSREHAGDEAQMPTDDQIRNNLLNERLSNYSENFLADLVSDAVITRP